MKALLWLLWLIILIMVFAYVFEDLNSPLLFGRLNGLSSDSTIDILYQLGTTQDSGTKDRYINTTLPSIRVTAKETIKGIFQTES